MAPLAPGDDEDRAPSACRRGPNDDGGKVPERKKRDRPGRDAAHRGARTGGSMADTGNVHELAQNPFEPQSAISSLRKSCKWRKAAAEQINFAA